MNRKNTTWKEFASRVRTFQIGFMGEPNEVRPGRGEFHENPSACICENSEAKARGDSSSQFQVGQKNGTENILRKDSGELIDEQFTEDEQDWSDTEYVENENGIRSKGLPNRTNSDSGLVVKPDQPELDEMFSD